MKLDLKKYIGKYDKKRILASLVYIAVIAAGIALDQLTKLVAAGRLMGEGPVVFIKGIIRFTYVENRGAAWGIFSDRRWVFMTVSTVAILAMLAYLFIFMKEIKWLYAIPVSLLISGGIGNMIDRICLGYVVDFIECYFIDFPVFNVADMIVCIGAGLLILALVLDIIAEGRKLKEEKKGEGK